MGSPQDTLFTQTQRVMRRLDEQRKGELSDADRDSMIEAVVQTYRMEGREPNREEIAATVDQVLAEEVAVANTPPKRKIPTSYWIAGGIIAIPLLFPLVRITEALVVLLIRIVV